MRNFYPQRPSTESAPVHTSANISKVSAVYCKSICQLMFGKYLPAESVYRISVYALGNCSKVSFKVVFYNEMRRKETWEISTRRGLFTESALMLLETSQKLVLKSFFYCKLRRKVTTCEISIRRGLLQNQRVCSPKYRTPQCSAVARSKF